MYAKHNAISFPQPGAPLHPIVNDFFHASSHVRARRVEPAEDQFSDECSCENRHEIANIDCHDSKHARNIESVHILSAVILILRYLQ